VSTDPTSRSRDEAGYILFGVVILLVVLGISLVAAVPSGRKPCSASGSRS
jgi:hypothetical protein